MTIHSFPLNGDNIAIYNPDLLPRHSPRRLRQITAEELSYKTPPVIGVIYNKGNWHTIATLVPPQRIEENGVYARPLNLPTLKSGSIAVFPEPHQAAHPSEFIREYRQDPALGSLCDFLNKHTGKEKEVPLTPGLTVKTAPLPSR